MKRVQNIGVVWVLIQIVEWSEIKVVFCSYRCFRESEKKICKRAKFFVQVQLFKIAFFSHLFFRHCFIFRVIVIVV